MKSKLTLMIAMATLAGCANQPSPQHSLKPAKQNIAVLAVPKPSQMTANVTTNGRVSTVIDIDVVNVGQQIPFTFSEGKVTNTPGFSWYVSKHFALKTDFPSERAAFFLRLLELSYPYYVEFFGMEPPNIDQQRIASTYATSNDKLRLAMFDDGFNRGIHDTAGGEAMYYNWVGYSFPTERPQHQRYIAIHETMHSYQMALGNYPWTPSWHGEGLGDSTANHIFDSEKQQLTVFGHDVPIFDMITWSLDTYGKETPTIEQIHDRKRFDRGLNVLFIQFMYNNPEYSQYIKIYHQEIAARQTDVSAESLAMLKSIVPDWAALEADFKTWVSQIKQSHDVTTRGQWEIDGNRFYKRESSHPYGPQRMDFTFTPAQQPQYDRFRLDFPLPDDSPLVSKAQRGVAEPTLGFELTYNAPQLNQGKLGIALAVESTSANSAAKKASYRSWKGANTDLDQQLRIEIAQGDTLLIDGDTLGLSLTAQQKSHALPTSIVNSLKAQSSAKLGLSVKIKPSTLSITLKTHNAQPFVVDLPIDAQLRQKLLNRRFGLLSSDNQHGITPYIDDGRDLNPHPVDYQQQTAANAWGFSADKLSQRFARANFKAGKQTPPQWRQAFDTLNRAALLPDQAQAMIDQVEQDLPQLAQHGRQLNEAMAELSGIQLQLDWLGDSLASLTEYAIITNHDKSDINGHIVFTVEGNKSQRFAVNAKAGERVEIAIPAKLLSQGDKVRAQFNYHWHDFAIEQQLEQKTEKYTGFSLSELNASYADDTLTIKAQVNGPFAGKTKGTVTFDLHHGEERQSVDVPLTIEPYQQLPLEQTFKASAEALKHDAWFEVTVVADSDGEPITLRKRLPYRPKKKAK